MGNPPSPECRERVQPGVIPILHNASRDQPLNLPLGHDSVAQVEPAVLPLHGAVQVQGVA